MFHHPDVRNRDLRLCPPGQLDKNCPQCIIALSVVTDPILLSRLFGDSDDTNVSDMKSRFGKRCDEIVPTMNLDADTMATVQQMLSQGQFHSKAIWNDVVKKHLTLPMTQHKSLTEDLKNEDVFNKLRHEHCYKNVNVAFVLKSPLSKRGLQSVLI